MRRAAHWRSSKGCKTKRDRVRSAPEKWRCQCSDARANVNLASVGNFAVALRLLCSRAMSITEERTRAYKQSFVPVQRLLDAGRFPDAVAELERLTAANTECAEAHNDLAVLYHAAGRLVDADRESRRALELDPFHTDIRDNRNAIAPALGNAGAAPAAAPASPPTASPVSATSFAAPAPVAAPASLPRTVIAPPTTSALASAPLYSEVLRT